MTSQADETLEWDKSTKEKFEKLIEKMPVVLRELARQKIVSKANILAKTANHSQILEKDMVDAFFAETPFGFQGLMKNDLKELGIDYTQYGYDK